MLGKNCARALPTLAVAEASCASWRLISGRCVSSSDGRPGVTRGEAIWLSEPPIDPHRFRRPRHQRRQRVDVLVERLPQRRHQRALVGEHALLLRDVEIVAGAGGQALLDGVEDALGAGDVALRGANPVLRGQHLEIGVGDRRQRRQRDDVAIEAVGDRGLFRRLRGVAVLAPEIELVAGAQRGRVIDHLAAAIGQAAGAGAGGAGIGLLTGAAEARQQRRAGDPRLRIGLPEPRGGGGDVEIDGLRLLHQHGQLARTEAAPPVERRRRVGSLRSPWPPPCSLRECRARDRADPWSGCSPRNWRRGRARQAAAPAAQPPEMRTDHPPNAAMAIRSVTPVLHRANPGPAHDERFS